jgi:hypothetical protein
VNQWPEADPDNPNSEHAISALFLMRPDGWKEQVAAVSERARAASEFGERRQLDQELRRSSTRISDLQERLTSAESLRDELEATRADELSRSQARHRRSIAGHKGQAARIQNQLEQTRAELERLKETNQDLAENLALLRRQKREKGPRAEGRQTIAWPRAEALGLARQLDDLAKASGVVGAEKPGETAPLVPVPLRIPMGIRPDRGEAMRWMFAITQPLTVAIDGWNVAHHLSSSPGPKERERVTEAARRIAIASVAKRRLLVIFDSQQGTLPLGDYRPPQTVEARFVKSADEELIEIARANPRALVVITSDRRVREAVQAAGAVGLWSEGLIEWFSAGAWK